MLLITVQDPVFMTGNEQILNFFIIVAIEQCNAAVYACLLVNLTQVTRCTSYKLFNFNIFASSGLKPFYH